MAVANSGRDKRAHGLETQHALLVAAGRVFARMPYAEARLRDIADEAGISQGSLYFHFGNKDDVARAVLTEQQARMAEILSRVTSLPGTALERILELFEQLSTLIATDVLVQAGIRLSMQPATVFEGESRAPYLEWVDVAESLLKAGINDGSVSPNLDTRVTAELLNEIFVGAQTLAGLEDKWVSLPRRVATARAGIRFLLSGPHV